VNSAVIGYGRVQAKQSARNDITAVQGSWIVECRFGLDLRASRLRSTLKKELLAVCSFCSVCTQVWIGGDSDAFSNCHDRAGEERVERNLCCGLTKQTIIRQSYLSRPSLSLLAMSMPGARQADGEGSDR